MLLEYESVDKTRSVAIAEYEEELDMFYTEGKDAVVKTEKRIEEEGTILDHISTIETFRHALFANTKTIR